MCAKLMQFNNDCWKPLTEDNDIYDSKERLEMSQKKIGNLINFDGIYSTS